MDDAGKGGRPDVRLPREADHPWHVVINRHADATTPRDDMRFMYEAKDCADEVPRLALLFKREREGRLAKVHHQCSRDHEGEAVPDNHLTCCLGVECRACPHLLAIDHVTRPEEERDVMKAWTCATHIIREGGDQAREGFVLTVDDKMYWQNVYESLAQGDEEEANG